MRVERLVPGRPVRADLAGAVLTRDIRVQGERWSKGRRLSAADLARLSTVGGDEGGGARLPGAISLLVIEDGDLHEDEAAARLAAAIAGAGLTTRGPAESRIDLVAAVDGVLHVDVRAVWRIDRLDPLEVFTAIDGSVVVAGQLVASVKVAPHVVAAAIVEAGEEVARSVRRGVVRVAGFVPTRVGVVVRETLRPADRERFERSVRDKVEGLGSQVIALRYVADEDVAVEAALRELGTGRSRARAILTAGARSTDPADPFFGAIERLGGRIVRHGVPAHPGSMLWLARLADVSILGLPTCGAYSRATAADLLLPRLLSGESPSASTVARLGHGGILTRDQRFRFPAYARTLDAPEG